MPLLPWIDLNRDFRYLLDMKRCSRDLFAELKEGFEELKEARMAHTRKLTKAESDEVLKLLADMPVDEAFRLLWLLGWTLKIVPKRKP